MKKKPSAKTIRLDKESEDVGRMRAEGQGIEEIATSLGLSPDNVRTRIRRFLKRLQRTVPALAGKRKLSCRHHGKTQSL